jgi:hypothetical protein
MLFHIPGVAAVPSDIISAKMIHLTYAALNPGELTFDAILRAAKRWAVDREGLLEYTFGREKHSHPTDPLRDEHFHCYLMFGKKVNLRNRRLTTVFDLLGRGGRILHPEVQSVGTLPGDRERVIKYDMKDGDYVGELRTPLLNDAKKPQGAAAASDSDRGEEADEIAPPS